MNKLIYIFILIVLVSCHNEEVQNIGNESEYLMENSSITNNKDTISKFSNCITELEKITDTIYYDLIEFYNIKNYQLFKIVAVKMKPIRASYTGFVVKKEDKVIDCVYIIEDSGGKPYPLLIRGKMGHNHKMPLDVELFSFDTLDLKADDNFYQAFVIDLKRYKLFDTIFKPYPVDSSKLNKYFMTSSEFKNPHEIDWDEFRTKQKDSLSIYYKKRNERIIQEKRKDSIEFYNKRDSLKNW